MSESSHTHEHAPDNKHESYEGLNESGRKSHERATHHTPEKSPEDVERLKHHVHEQDPTKSSELLDKLKTEKEDKPVTPPNSELRRLALANYLTEIRSNLRSASRAFSKIIHKPTINAISEVGAKTIMRPTAVLFGGVFMFIGSSLYLYATYRTNACYNFFVALFLFFGGFMAGIIVELFYDLFFRKGV